MKKTKTYQKTSTIKMKEPQARQTHNTIKSSIPRCVTHKLENYITAVLQELEFWVPRWTP